MEGKTSLERLNQTVGGYYVSSIMFAIFMTLAVILAMEGFLRDMMENMSTIDTADKLWGLLPFMIGEVLWTEQSGYVLFNSLLFGAAAFAVGTFVMIIDSSKRRTKMLQGVGWTMFLLLLVFECGFVYSAYVPTGVLLAPIMLLAIPMLLLRKVRLPESTREPDLSIKFAVQQFAEWFRDSM